MRDSRARVLDPIERVSEVLFGLIMVLTFTGSLSVADAGHGEVREMLAGALSCNLAWGIVDAVMYVLGSALTRRRGLAVLKAFRDTTDPAAARAVLADATHPLLASALGAASIESIRRDLIAAPAVRERSWWHEDLRGAAAVFLLVFLSTFPVAFPFLVFGNIARAMRVSNAVAVALLCIGGYSLGRYSGLHPWATAGTLAALGIVLVGITMALGG